PLGGLALIGLGAVASHSLRHRLSGRAPRVVPLAALLGAPALLGLPLAMSSGPISPGLAPALVTALPRPAGATGVVATAGAIALVGLVPEQRGRIARALARVAFAVAGLLFAVALFRSVTAREASPPLIALCAGAIALALGARHLRRAERERRVVARVGSA